MAPGCFCLAYYLHSKNQHKIIVIKSPLIKNLLCGNASHYYFNSHILYILHTYYSLFHKADQSGDNALSYDEFEQSLKEMDKNLTQLPPIAQVKVVHIFSHLRICC